MLSIQNVTSGQASRYYSEDAYYTKEQLSGQWLGRGAELLGLKGDFKKEDFERIIQGKDRDGAELIERGFNGRHQAGKDLTFSTPKSVSVLYEVLGDDKVKEAHDMAVKRALSYTEKHFSEARITKEGVTESVGTGNLVIAAFAHDSSRELDPQLHSHAVVMNMTMRQDGKWRALASDKTKGDELYRNKMFIGQIYRNELAKNLKALGYEVVSDKSGLFEVKGMDQSVLDEFSRRKDQIDERVKKLQGSGLYPQANGQKLREIAALGSRVCKKDVDLTVVRSAWMERLQSMGYQRQPLLRTLQRQPGVFYAHNPDDYIRTAVRGITEKEAVFRRKAVLENSLKLSLGQCGIDDLKKAFDELAKDEKAMKDKFLDAGRLLSRHIRDDFSNFKIEDFKKQIRGIFESNKEIPGKVEMVVLDKKQGLYTTKEMQRMEKQILQKVQSGHHAFKPILQPQEVDKFLTKKYSFMTQGQTSAVKEILCGSQRYVAIQGDAGTGKTTSLKAAKELLEGQGFVVRGLAYTGKAGAEMMQNAGTVSRTLHAFLADFHRNGGTEGFSKGKEVWVVDEAGMVGNRQMHQLCMLAEKVGARVVLMGDTKQLSGIEAGRIFAKLQESGSVKTVRMKEVLRQKDEAYKDIVIAASEKKINRAFDKLKNHQKLVEIPDSGALKKDLIVNYTQQDSDRCGLVVTTLNKDRKALNNAIRQRLQLQGKLPEKQHIYTTRESKSHSSIDRHFCQFYRQGDIVTINKVGTGIRVGEEGRITHIRSDQNSICIVTAKGALREIDVKKHGEKISVFSEKETPFSQNDRVVFLKNNKPLNVQNGLTGRVKSMNEKGDIVVVLDAQSKREVGFNIKDYNYLDHGYVVTDYKSQGQTANKVFYHAPTYKALHHENINTYNSFYVALTRGRFDIRVYTDDIKTLKEQVKIVNIKSSTLDYTKKQNAKPDVSILSKTQRLRFDLTQLKRPSLFGIAKSFIQGKEHVKELEK